MGAALVSHRRKQEKECALRFDQEFDTLILPNFDQHQEEKEELRTALDKAKLQVDMLQRKLKHLERLTKARQPWEFQCAPLPPLVGHATRNFDVPQAVGATAPPGARRHPRHPAPPSFHAWGRLGSQFRAPPGGTNA